MAKLTLSKGKPEKEVEAKKDYSTTLATNHPKTNDDAKKEFGPSILRIDGKNSFIEVTERGFHLSQTNSKGEIKNQQCKVHLNFVEYDKNFNQTGYIPFYFDSLEWKGLLEDLRSGIFDKKAEEFLNSKDKYPVPMYSYMKGTTSSDGKTYARVLEIRAAQKPYHFLMSCTGGEGVTSQQGTVTFKKGCDKQKISVLISHTALGGMLADVASRIPAMPLQ